MLFNSLIFIVIFLPIAFAGFYVLALIHSLLARIWLVFMSFVFYYWWHPLFVFLLAGSVLFNYICSLLLFRLNEGGGRQTAVLTFAITSNLLLLVYYKYLFPFLNWLDLHHIRLLAHHPADVMLPLGISFFTFTQIGYLLDCKGGTAQRQSPLNYALFVTFFPHLICGPILHHKEIMPQFAREETYRFRLDNVALGLAVFCIGLAKKVLLADHFAIIANDIFLHPYALPLWQAWSGALSYALQLYFDFSGYSEMAVGLALMFNVRFPANFDSPYKSTSIIDFWQRWHMTLTRYITLYLYNPAALWVRRSLQARGKSIAPQAMTTPGGFFTMVMVPTFYTIILAALWHGPGWPLICFGLLQSSYLCVNQAWRFLKPWQNWPLLRAKIWPPLIVPGKIILTFIAVVVSQVFFHSQTMVSALALLKAMAGMNGVAGIHPMLHQGMIEQVLGWYHRVPAWVSPSGMGNPFTLMVAFAFIWTMPNVLQIFQDYAPTLSSPQTPCSEGIRWRPNLVWGFAIGGAAALAILWITGSTEFLYFKF